MTARPVAFEDLRPGDIVRLKNGRARTVLWSSQKNGRLNRVTFVIRHCSWTKRPTTILDRYTLKQCFKSAWRPARPRLTKLQRLALKDSQTPGYRCTPNGRGGILDCCDVVGVTW